MQKTLGQRIRELRGTRDLSLRELARQLDISAAFLSDIELGRRNPSGKVLDKLADVLGTTRKDLEAHDVRPPVQELRRRAASDPAYGIAFRRMLESNKTPDEIIQWVEKKNQKDKSDR